MKIVQLELLEDSLLSGIDAMALVEKPAIEDGFFAFAAEKFAETYTDYPEAAVEAAKQGIKRNEEIGNKCATQVGKVRAQQLANREPVSLDTVRRMRAFLIRQKDNYELAQSRRDYNACGYISYLLWGGAPALSWAEKTLRQAGEEFAEVGPRGGIKESPKAPKSDTPNPDPKGEGTARGSAGTTRGAKVDKATEESLKKKADEFNEKYKDKLGYGANVGALKSVYQRGLGAYNTSRSPEVASRGGAKQWAMARVNAFLYLIKNGRPQNRNYTTDYDLLPTKHPKRKQFGQIMESIIAQKMVEQMMFAQPKVVYLVSCCSQQTDEPGEAIDVYCSDLFEKSLNYCYAKGAKDKDIKILSSKYGVVDIHDMIKPYDICLGDKSAKTRKEWSEEVFEELDKRYNLDNTKFVFLAGEDYTQYLKDMLPKYDDVLEGKKIGERLEYLDRFNLEVSGLPNYTNEPTGELKVNKEASYGFAAVEDQQMLVGPAMVPGKLIPRKDEDGDVYYVYFTKDTIKKLAYKAMKDKIIDRVNIEHNSGELVDDVYLVESWIVEDSKTDKAKMYGLNPVEGTWMTMYKVDNLGVWEGYVKPGLVKGFSIEGYFAEQVIKQ
jgi:hypothetical protein